MSFQQDITPHPKNCVIEVGLSLARIPLHIQTRTAQPSPTTDLEDLTTADDTMGYDAYLEPALEATTPHSSAPLKTGAQQNVPTDTNFAMVAMDTNTHLATPTKKVPNTCPDVPIQAWKRLYARSS